MRRAKNIYDPGPWKDFFYYTWEVVLTANGSGTDSVTILADSDFIAIQGVASMYQDVAARTHVDFQDVLVSITDSGSGRQLQDTALPLRHVFGHPQEPVHFEPPKLFKGSSVVTVVFTNGANAAVRIHATMSGYKRFRR